LDEKDHSVCCVCHKLDLQSEDTHSLMKCQGCCILSHPDCQGLDETPVNWLCDRCFSEQNRVQSNLNKSRFKEKCKKLRLETKCAYCQKPDGSMLYQNELWVHNVCAAWLPGFSFNAEESYIKSCNAKIKCTVCKGTEQVIHCSEPNCKFYYHGICAQESGYYFDIHPEGKPLSYCSSHSMKKRNKNFQTLLPLGQGRVDIGQFLTKTTKLELEKLINKNISEETFDTLWDYWKNKRLDYDYGRTPLIPRLEIEKNILQELSSKEEQIKLNEAKLRWESLKTKLFPKKKSTQNRSTLNPLSSQKNNIQQSTRHQPINNNNKENNNDNFRNRPIQPPLISNNTDYSDDIDDVETNIEESEYEYDLIQYDDAESEDSVEILHDTIALRTSQNNEIAKRVSKPSIFLNEKDYALPERNSSRIRLNKNITNKNITNKNKKVKPILTRQRKEKEMNENRDQGEEQEDNQEECEMIEERTPARTGKKRTFESATLFPTPGSILYKKVKIDDNNNSKNNTIKNNNETKNNHHKNNYTNNNENNNTSNGKKLLYKLDQTSQIDSMRVDKKEIMQEKATKTRPPTRAKPGKIASGIPTYYGAGENRIVWRPNVQFSRGDKKESGYLFGAGFPSPVSHADGRQSKRT